MQWQRIVWPVVVFVAGIVLWDLVVRIGEIPPYLLPGPVARLSDADRRLVGPV